MRIRIFALAKELGLDSKDLIQHCTEAGLNVKNSALASITEAERDRLMAYLDSQGSEPPAAPVEEDSMRPVRPQMSDREIRDLSGGQSQPKTRRSPRKPSAQDLEEVTAEEAVETPAEVVAEETSTTAVEPVEAEQPATTDDVSEEAPSEVPADEVESPVSEVEEPVEPEATPEVSADAEVQGEDESDDDPGVAGPPKMSPISREDYIAPTGGGGGASGIREMKPVGSVRDRVKPKKKSPALPAVAATPNFKPVAKKADQGPVQKPDLALTGDVLKQGNKLKSLIDKSKKEVKREEDGPAKRGRGLSLEESRQRRKSGRSRRTEDEENVIRRGQLRTKKRSGPIERKTEAVIESPISVRTLAEAMGRPAKDIITVLFKQGTMATINDPLEVETALEVALELGVDLQVEQEADFEERLADRLDRADEDFDAELQHRPPIITVLGHVDHGKTTLVDTIRHSNVVKGEAGGITQHIAAYQVEHNGQKLTFVDTPGHAAFGEMRARGANVTDIVVLVVAADDGVMPQTIECISHAKAAGVPIVVAMNKCDLPGKNEQKVLTELSQHGVLPQEWGGDTEVIRVSALKNEGIDDLLETLLLTAEINEYKTAVDIPAEGACLEAFRDEGRGPLAWIIVRRGTLRVGDLILCGPAYGRVRAMYNDKDEELQEAGPSQPVKIAGLDNVPGAGDHFFVMSDIDDAREMAEQRKVRGRTAVLAGRGGPVDLETFFARQDGSVKDLPLIIKGDTPGSLEAIKSELGKFDHDEVKIKILHDAVGGVNESDVYLAASSGAIIIAFHVIAEDRAEALASQEGVEIRRYNIIYNLIDDIRDALEGLLSPERFEVPTGRALVLQTFSISRVGTIAGCRILNGTISRDDRVHVIRDQTILNNYGIASLRREKDDAKEVREGFECGIRLEGFNDVKEGDLLEAYRIEERKRTLDE